MTEYGFKHADNDLQRAECVDIPVFIMPTPETTELPDNVVVCVRCGAMNNSDVRVACYACGTVFDYDGYRDGNDI